MGFFRKQKITIEQLADSLADIALQPGTAATISDLLKEEGHDSALNSEQEKEIIILEMLSTVRAVQKVVDSKYMAQTMLDDFHAAVYKRMSRFEHEQTEFEKLVTKRYQAYYEILNMAQPNKMFHFGKQFADYLMSRDMRGDGLALIMFSGEMFVKTIELRENFLKQSLDKYELVEAE